MARRHIAIIAAGMLLFVLAVFLLYKKHDNSESLIVDADAKPGMLPEGAVARLGNASYFFASDVGAIVFSPCGETMVSCDGWHLHLWNAADYSWIVSFKSESYISDVSFFPDSTTLAVCTRESRVHVWDLIARKRTPSVGGLQGSIYKAAVSPNGKYMATVGNERDSARSVDGLYRSSDYRVRLWNAASKKEIPLDAIGGLAVAFSPDSQFVAWAGHDDVIRLCDSTTGDVVRNIGDKSDVMMPTNGLAFSPDGMTIAASGRKGVRLYNVTSGHLAHTLIMPEPTRTGEPYWHATFSYDGKYVASGSEDGTIGLWDVGTGHEVTRFSEHSGWVCSVAFTPDDKTLISGSQGLRFWNLATLAETPKAGHSREITSVALSPDRKHIATASMDKTVRLWDAETYQEKRVLTGHDDSVTDVAYSPNGKLIATASLDRTVAIWEASTGKRIRSLKHHSAGVRCVAFSPNGNLLASGAEDGFVILWKSVNGERVCRFENLESRVADIAFSPNGRMLAAGTSGRPDFGKGEYRNRPHHLVLFDVETGEELSQLERPFEIGSIAFSPDGRYLISNVRSPERALVLWDIETGQEKDFGKFDSGIVAVAFSPDGKSLAVGGWGEICLLDTASGEIRRRLKGHCRKINSLGFSKDGKMLISGGDDGTAIVWKNEE